MTAKNTNKTAGGIQFIIEDVQSKGCFNDCALFLIRNESINYSFLMVSIIKSNDKPKKYTIAHEDYQLPIYEIGYHTLMSLILNKNEMISDVFRESICIKDFHNIARIIYQYVGICRQSVACMSDVILDKIWTSLNVKCMDAVELNIKFMGIASGIAFYRDVVVGCLSALPSEILVDCPVILYFENKHEDYSLIVTFYKLNEDKYTCLLDNIQTYLYTRSSLLQLNKILLPYARSKYSVETQHNVLFDRILSLFSLLQSTIIVRNINKDINDKVLFNEYVNLYILWGKTCFPVRKDFFEFNNQFYHSLLGRYVDGIHHYVLSSIVKEEIVIKTRKELYKLTMLNAQSIHANFFEEIRRWDCVNDLADFFQLSFDEIAVLSNNDLSSASYQIKKDTFSMLVDMMDLNPFVKMFIPEIIKFLEYEI